MRLVIHAHALRKEAHSQAFTGVFDERGGTIGRSDTNTLTLPDPERHVSRLQAEVTFGGSAFAIRNVGSANAIEINGRALEPGESAPLAVGDRLVIGGYTLDVAAPAPTGQLDAAPARPADSRTVIRASASEVRTGPPRLPGIDPFDALWSSAASAAVPSPDDPFADLLGPVAAPPSPSLSLSPAVPGLAAKARAAAPPARAPAASAAAFDPFADLDAPLAAAPPSASAPGRAAAAAHDDALADFLGGLPSGPGAGAGAPSLDALFGLGGPAGGSATDSLDEFLAPARPQAQRPPAQAPAADHAPALSSAYRPPAIAAPPAPSHMAPVRSTPPADTSAEQALWQAFCEGAGLSMTLPQGLNPELMRVMGQILRHAVDGTLKLVVARAGTKQELRAQVTVIQSRNNNPLKFSVDPESAMTQLLQPPVRGFMTGPEAMSDAMDDLLGHHFGTMMGMRAALAGVLQRFEPAQLERKLAGKGLLDTLLPMNRRARLWDLYVEHCQQVQDEAQDDFHELFGKAFVKAYEEQLDRLHEQRRRGGGG